jgi:replicative DNA helicase
VIIADKDEPGRKHAKDVAQKLSVAARSIRILEMPGAAKDVSDWVAAGGSLLALEVLVDDLPEFEASEKVIWTPRDLARDFREVTAKRQAGDEAYTGWPLGFRSLDRELRYTPGDMWLIAAGTGVGKSTLLQELERRATVPTIFFSVEMSRQQLMDRTIAANAGVDSWKVRRGALGHDDLEKVMAEVDDYERREDHLLVENAGLTTATLESILRIARVRFGVRIAYLDYIQKMSGRGDSEYSRVTTISNDVARIARQTDVNIVAAVQVNREAKDGEPPRKRDLGDSGYLEKNAATILSIGRTEGSTDMKIVIRKSRSGIEGFSADFVFDALHSRILEKSEARVGSVRPAK